MLGEKLTVDICTNQIWAGAEEIYGYELCSMCNGFRFLKHNGLPQKNPNALCDRNPCENCNATGITKK